MARAPSIDLHVHSNFSDGLLTPDELARRAVLHNVTVLAITDHDTLAGSADKAAACRRHGLVAVTGVELSCEREGKEVHILSLFADPDSPAVARIGGLSLSRRDRMALMLERLSKLGIAIAMAELPVADDGVYGRPHLARAMVAKGVVKSVNEAFARYLYDAGPVHIDKERLSVAEGVRLAHDLGGVAVLAHPGVSGWVGSLEFFAAEGMDGVEVYHPKHGGETIAKLLRSCREFGLLASGGSDFHGPGDGSEVGSARVPVDLLEPLAAMARERKRHGIL